MFTHFNSIFQTTDVGNKKKIHRIFHIKDIIGKSYYYYLWRKENNFCKTYQVELVNIKFDCKMYFVFTYFNRKRKKSCTHTNNMSINIFFFLYFHEFQETILAY